MSVRYEHPRPALTVDCVLLGFDGTALRVLLVERKNDPYAGRWALPGGFVDMSETVGQAAARELREETGVRHAGLRQLHTFSAPNRDPRERVVSVAHYGVVRPHRLRARGGDDAARAEWKELCQARRLAFDHDQIVAMALDRVRADATRTAIVFEMLPKRFTRAELRAAYQALLGRGPRGVARLVREGALVADERWQLVPKRFAELERAGALRL